MYCAFKGCTGSCDGRLSSGAVGGNFDENDASAVQAPSDEFELWTELASRGDARAKGFSTAFASIARGWSELPNW